MLPTLTAFSAFQRTAPAVGASSTTDPALAAEIAYFRETLPSVRSAGDFTGDPRLFAFAAKAFGFGENLPSRTTVALALEDGAGRPDSYANRWPDARIEAMARLFALPEYGKGRWADRGLAEAVVDRFLRAQTGTTPPGGAAPSAFDREADYFRRKIGEVESAADLVADIGLYTFTLKAFGLEDRAGDRALIARALASGTDEGDLVTRLGDERLVAMTRAFGFERTGTFNVSHEGFADSIIAKARALSEPPAIDTDDPDTAYFVENIGKVRNAEDLLGDARLYRYVMTAFDLGDELGKKAIVGKALTESVGAEESLINKLPDPRFRELARTLGMGDFGVRNLRDPAVLDRIVTKHERVKAEQKAGEENPAVELAAYFDRKAQGLTSWLFVTADTRLREVVFTALDMPQVMATMDTDRLVAEFEKRFDIKDFQDPEKRADFIKRFAALADTASGGPSGMVRGSGALSLLSSAGSGGGLYALTAQL